MFGDKVKAREQAESRHPRYSGSDGPAETLKDVEQFAKVHGFPFIIKASLGGGYRGMRIVRSESELKESFER